MRKIKYIQIFIYFAVITLFLSASCTQSESKTKNITVSILPQKYIVKSLLGDTANVNVMVLPNQSPAVYSPSSKQMRMLNDADLYLAIGNIGFEITWLDKISHLNPSLTIVDTSEGVEFIETEEHHEDHHNHSGVDPHIWVLPDNMKIIAKNTKDALVGKYPLKEKKITENYKKLENKINLLISLYDNGLIAYKGKAFFVYHPAYTYIAKKYGLIQHSIENEGKEPSPKYLTQLIDKAKELDINTIFIQKEFDKRNAELISKEIGAKIVEINPLNEDWEKETINALNKLKRSLK